MIKISIITINKNNAKGLERTIKSVVSQSYKNIEFIVIDGDSCDESVEIIKRYSDKITKWKSEPDSGIYNAMNKGASLASGDYSLFLNSGDKLADIDSIKDILEYTTFDADIISCDLVRVKDNKSYYSCAPTSKVSAVNMITANRIPHPSTFIRTKLIQSHKYNENYKIAGDFVFFFECLILGNYTYQYIPRLLSVFYHNGISSQNGNIIGREEGIRFLSGHIDLNILKEIRGTTHKREYDLCNSRAELGDSYFNILHFVYRVLYLVNTKIVKLKSLYKLRNRKRLCV